MRALFVLLWCLLASPAFSQTSVMLVPPDGTAGHAVCGSAVSSCVAKASPGQFLGVYAECSVACWVMVFNRTTAPTNGSTTAGTASGNMSDCFEIATNDTSKSLFYTPYPVWYSVGITVAISSATCTTLTLATVGFVSVVYK